ncbi:MAG TPA: non-homologous end-joining DNA ligase [Acidimicrobiales bacterium]|nr:non-homologous end-joining DNA ligase [Acidimicrobiales bacterium]
MSPESRVETEVDGRRLSLSNLDKVLYPKVGFTKRDVIDYYARIADVMLPHLRERPVTLRRFPNGVDEPSFFEKHAPSHMPSWVRSTMVPSMHGRHEPIKFAIVCDRPSLVWAANLAALELHVPLWKVEKSKKLPTPPDYIVFDLDPGPGTSIVECCRVARWIDKRLTDGGLGAALPKTSGSKGLQLYLPLKQVKWEDSRDQAHDLALSVEKDHPELVVSNMRKDLRQKHVLIDWSQNQPAKTTVAAYSLRARPEPTVSTPITWEEVDACAKSGNPDDLNFVSAEVLERVDKFGDLMAELGSN